MTPIMWSAFKTQNANPLSLLLKLGSDLNRTDLNYYNTALHWAAVAGNLNAIRELLKFGANLEALNKQNETPLDIAKHEGHISAVRILETAARRRGLTPTNWKHRLREDEVSNCKVMCY
jgi:ankyrin repeat protein